MDENKNKENVDFSNGNQQIMENKNLAISNNNNNNDDVSNNIADNI